MQGVLAALPIGLVIATMVMLRWRAAHAGLLGLAVALLLAIGAFGLGGEPASPAVAFVAVGGATLEALFTTAIILWIVFPALCIYELQRRTGGFEVIRGSLTRLSDDRRVQVLLVAWFFGLFLEGVAGFGAPVALAAPILVGLGFSPIRAVVLALAGHAAGVSFGAVGTPVLPQMAAAELSGIELARAAALLHALVGWLLVGALFLMAEPDRRPRLADLRWPALAALLFIAPFLALAWWTGPELPTIGGAIIGGALFALIVARTRADAGQTGPRPREVARAALPYLVLVALILATRMVLPLRDALQSIEIRWSFEGAFHGSMAPVYHPGTLLFASFVLGGLLQGRKRSELLTAMAAAAHRLGVVALALAAMLALSRILVHSGMIAALAEAASATGVLWPFAAVFIGVLGTFVTGSATASNILFSEFQHATALELDLAPATMHGAQNFGAAIGNVISPHNIIAGAATVGLAGAREGEIMRAAVPACLAYAAAGGALTLWLAHMS